MVVIGHQNRPVWVCPSSYAFCSCSLLPYFCLLIPRSSWDPLNAFCVHLSTLGMAGGKMNSNSGCSEVSLGEELQDFGFAPALSDKN